MEDNKRSVEARSSAIAIVSIGCIVGASVAVAHYRSYQSISAAIGSTLAGGLAGTLVWMMLLSAYYNKRNRRRRNRRRRRELGIRSPWGEKRIEPACPYADRLSHFLTHAVAPSQYSQKPKSGMTFWSLFDLPHDAVGAKPTWLIRRILRRIQQAVRG